MLLFLIVSFYQISYYNYQLIARLTRILHERFCPTKSQTLPFAFN